MPLLISCIHHAIPHIQHLSFPDRSLGVLQLAPILQLVPNLKRLDLERSKIYGSEVQQLVNALVYVPQLQHLNLDENYITDVASSKGFVMYQSCDTLIFVATRLMT